MIDQKMILICKKNCMYHKKTKTKTAYHDGEF